MHTRKFSHWHSVETTGYWKDGKYHAAYLTYPVYEDELTLYESEVKQMFAQRRQLDAECLVLDRYIEIEKKRAELARLTGTPVRALGNR